MKLTVFGASSATGRHLVEQALRAGHELTAFVRDESRLGIAHQKLRVITGNAMNATEVERAVKDNDAVLSTLGPKGKHKVMAAECTKNIVDAMEKHGVKRLVVVSVAGIPVPQDERGANFASRLIKLFLKDVFKDRENQLAVLESSSVDWTAVRVPRLTDGPAKGSVQAFFGNPSPRMKVTRADLANFMLEQLRDDRWRRKAPILSN